MNGRDSFKRCKFCGKPVGVIERGLYRKVLVDAGTIMVEADPLGEEFIRIDGSKMRGREIKSIDEELTYQKTEYVYRPHRKTCGVDA